MVVMVVDMVTGLQPQIQLKKSKMSPSRPLLNSPPSYRAGQ